MTARAGDRRWDAIVIGAGPNGLSAAITLAAEGRDVLLVEARDRVGGGVTSEELTLPGFVHDVCSAVHPFAAGSPAFRSLPLDRYGVEFIHPDIPLAHPLGGDRAAAVYHSLDRTADELGRDGPAWRRVVGWVAAHFDEIVEDALGPIGPPRHPFVMGRFGWDAIRSAAGLARSSFSEAPARAALGGSAAHVKMPLESLGTAAFGLMLCAAIHAVGWPIVRGGSQCLADGLAAHFESLGGTIETGRPITSLDDLPPSRAVLFDLTPRQILDIAGDTLPGHYRRRLEGFRYGSGVFKVDFAVSQPIPWTAEAPRRAGTVHLGGTLEEIAASERIIARGEVAEQPYVLLSQPSLFDPTRAPEGKHTVWAYCHVPHGCPVDMRERIIRQIERYAPGFRDTILATSALGPADLEAHNANYIGGDINGGAQDLRQLFTRPVARIDPYTTPNERLYICSSSTPPGGGVHGLCGMHAARSVLKRH